MAKFSELVAYACFILIKNIINVYDVLTYPIYYIVQKPWIKKQKYDRIRAVQEDPSNPYSSWVRVGEPPEMIIDKCTTIDEIMRTCFDVYKNRPCMGYRQVLEEIEEVQSDGKVHIKKRLAPEYTFLSYSQVSERLDHIMRGLLLSGVKPLDKLIIFMETRMEWMLTAQALYRMGGCVATVYATLGEEGVVHVINEVGSAHILTSADLLPKLKKISNKLHSLKTIIYLEDHFKHKSKSEHGFEGTGIELIRFDDMETDGRNAPEDLVGQPPKPDDIALIMYTSGSTGVPKGVMLWHYNYVASLKSLYTVFPDLNPQEGDWDVGFLPLAHNLEFTKEHLEFVLGIGVAYASPLTLTDTSPGLAPGTRGDIMLVKPSALIVVPLILDRIRKSVIDKMEQKGKFAQLLFEYIIEYKNYWVALGFNTPIINYLVSRKIRAAFGGKLRGVFCGGASLSTDTQRFARACLDVTVMQGYGATETTAVATLMDLFDWSEGCTGSPVFGTKVRLVDWEEGGYRPTDKPLPRGEVVVGGPSITAGYYKQEDVTAEAFRVEDGVRWFYTGDIGEFYPDGKLKIIDRKKDLLKLAFGEYVSLGKVEAEIKSCSFVDNMCAYGDPFENYIVALVIPNINAVKMLAQRLGRGNVTDDSIRRLYSDPEIVSQVSQAIVAHAKKAGLHKSEIPQKIKLCTEDWTPENALLTAGLKIRRRPIQDFYKSDLQQMYQKKGKAVALDINGNVEYVANDGAVSAESKLLRVDG